MLARAQPGLGPSGQICQADVCVDVCECACRHAVHACARSRSGRYVAALQKPRPKPLANGDYGVAKTVLCIADASGKERPGAHTPITDRVEAQQQLGRPRPYAGRIPACIGVSNLTSQYASTVPPRLFCISRVHSCSRTDTGAALPGAI